MVLTALFAVVHLTTRTQDVEGAILVNGKQVELSSLDYENVTGTVVNGKGEQKQIDAQGVPLEAICGSDFETATITASDEYSARVSADELDNAYIIIDEDTPRLIVFGDENSKRDVKNVVRIDTDR